MSDDNRRYLLGIFEDDEDLVHAAQGLKNANVKIYDAFTPFPLHGLDELLDIKRTRLPLVCFGAAAFGLIFAILFQTWTHVFDWPVVVGGKSHNAFPAFIPVAFEITVLFGALATVGAFFLRAKLFPGACGCTPVTTLTDNHFVLAVEEADAGLDFRMVEQIFKKNGARDVVLSERRKWCKH